MKNILTIIALALGLNFASAQEEAIFTHYHINPILINSGAAGFSGLHHLQMNLKNQWTGFPGAPATYAVNYNGPMTKRLGIGLNVLSEEIAQISRVKGGINYAFRFRTSEKVKLAIGFSTEFEQFALAQSIYDQPNPLYEVGDNVVEAAIDGLTFFDADLGLFGTYKEDTYFGISFPSLIRSKLNDIETAEDDGNAFTEFYIATVGHKFDFEDYDFNIRPSVMIRKMEDIPFQIDFNVLGGFVGDKLQAGVSYRSGVGGAMGLLLGTQVNPFSVYYSYDVSFQGFQQYSNGTHEITLSFDFGKMKNDKGGSN